MLDLSGKTYVVFGVASAKSICWGITEQLRSCGAETILCVHPDMLERVGKKLAEPNNILNVYPCDVTDERSIKECFQTLSQHTPINGIVHGIAFSNRDELKGRFIHTSRDNFDRTLAVSCYSLIEIARRAMVLMPEGGSILTLTFDASRGTYPHYNVMGVAKAALEAAMRYLATDLGEENIRVNAISASPIDTLSGRGIANFQLIGQFAEGMSPFSRRAAVAEVAQTATFLLSNASSGITGQTVFVDCGSSVPIMAPARNAGTMAEAYGKIAETYEVQETKSD